MAVSAGWLGRTASRFCRFLRGSASQVDVELVCESTSQPMNPQAPNPNLTQPHPYASHDPLLEIAVELESIALNDDYFKSRHLYPNVEFYSGVVLRALGIPISM